MEISKCMQVTWCLHERALKKNLPGCLEKYFAINELIFTHLGVHKHLQICLAPDKPNLYSD